MVLEGDPLGRISAQLVRKQFFGDPHIFHLKPFPVLNKTVHAKVGPSGETLDMHFCPIGPKCVFPWPLYNPLQIISSFEQNDLIQKTVLQWGPLGRTSAQLVLKLFSVDPYIMHFKPIPLLSKTVHCKVGPSWEALQVPFCPIGPKDVFSLPLCNPF